MKKKINTAVLHFFEWTVRNRDFRKILGCEYDGTMKDTLLDRFFIYRTRLLNHYLHIFRRSDQDRELHDHPWHFVSLVVWPGYIEETVKGKSRKWPGMILIRPANWKHRVELVPGHEYSISLIWVTKDVRDWGFWLGNKFTQWQQYFKEKGC